MEQQHHSPSSPSSASVHVGSSAADAAATTSSSNAAQVLAEEDGGEQYHRFPHPGLEHRPISSSFRRSFGDLNDGARTVIREDTWSCVVVVLTFWFFGLYPVTRTFTAPGFNILLLFCGFKLSLRDL